MNLTSEQIKTVLEQAKKSYYDASKEAEYTETDPDSYDRMETDVRTMYEMLTLAADAMGLQRVIENLRETFQRAEKTGLQTVDHFEGEAYSAAGNVLYPMLTTLLAIFGEQPIDPNKKELGDILRRAGYYINKLTVFADHPAREEEVHDRIEGLLGCFYTINRKPPQPKTIKTFIPDTGVEELGTLIEYKYINDENDLKIVADQVLADISGYNDRKWPRLLFVIYETRPLLQEEKWKKFVDECGATERADVLVITGAQPNNPKVSKKRRQPQDEAVDAMPPQSTGLEEG